ncbi:helix-turn-helix domain-containing protein [Cupriavidus basilensis]
MNKVEYIERDGERFALVPAEAWEALKEFGETLIPAGDPSNPAAETGMPHFVLLAQLAGDSRLRAWRRYRGLQQKVLADKVGMGRSYLTMIESGEREGERPNLAKPRRDFRRARLGIDGGDPGF